MRPTNIKFVGAPCGQHGPYTFYKAFKYIVDKKPKILALGEFFFVKIFKDLDVCIGELQLLWEDRYNPGQYLCMVRLYFLPEQTPDGRKSYNGEDEVLMESDKVPFLLEDLVSLLTDTMEWTAGSTPFTHKLAPLSDKALRMLSVFATNNRGLDMSDVNKERKLVDQTPHTSQVIIVNYPQYCRYRAVLARLDGCADGWMRSLLVGALGGITTVGTNTRVLFCRDSFEHPVIQEHELRQDHLAPNLRGRPKKKRAHFRKYEKDHVYSNESDDDSNDSVTSSEKSGSRSSPAKIKVKDKVKLGRPPNGSNITSLRSNAKKPSLKRKKKKKGEDVDEIDSVKIDISPLKPSHKTELTKAEERFLKRLMLFMREQHITIARLPKLGFKEIDLYEFYNMTLKLGGYAQVTGRKLWKQIYDALGGNPSNTSAATCTRKHYERMLKQFELHQKGIKLPAPEPIVKKAKKRKTSTEDKITASTDSAKKSRDEEPANELAPKSDKPPATPTKKEPTTPKKKIKDIMLNESEKENLNNDILNNKSPVHEINTDISTKPELKVEAKADIKPVENIPPSQQTTPKPSPQKPNILEQSKQVPAFTCVQSASGDVKINESPVKREHPVPVKPEVKPTVDTNAPLIKQPVVGQVKLSSLAGIQGVRINADGQAVFIGLRPNMLPPAHAHSGGAPRLPGVQPGTGSGNAPRQPPPAHAHKQTTKLNPAVQQLLLVNAAGKAVSANLGGNNIRIPLPGTNQAVLMKPPASHVKKNPQQQVPNSAPGTAQIRQAHLKGVLPSRRINEIPANQIGHNVVKYKGLKTFFNPAPSRCHHNRKIFKTAACYESPDIRSQLTRPKVLKRGYPSGAGYLKEMNLQTPPPAHCNPTLRGVTSRKLGFPPPNANNCNNALKRGAVGGSGGDPPVKKPRLVSDYISMQAAGGNPGTSAAVPPPPRNPFVNKGLLNVNNLANIAGFRPRMIQSMIGAGGNGVVPVALPQPAAHQQGVNVNQRLPLPTAAHHSVASSQKALTTQAILHHPAASGQLHQDGPLDLSAKPLRIQTQNMRHLNKPSSPIVISPTSNDEPMNLCVKKNVHNLTCSIPKPNAMNARFARSSGSATQHRIPHKPSVIQTPPTVVQSPVVSLHQALTQSPLSLLPSHPSVIQANPSLLQGGGSIIQTNLPVLPTAISPSAGAVLPAPTMAAGSVIHSAASVLHSGNTLLQSGGSVLQQTGGSLLQSAGASLLQSGGSLIQSGGSAVMQTPVISLSSVIKPPSASDAARSQNSKQVRIGEPQLSPAVASLLHPAFLNASSMSISNAMSLPISTIASSNAVQAGQQLVLPVSQLVSSASSYTPTALPFMIPMQQMSQLLGSAQPVAALQTSTST